jgi:hypothetical protein
MLLGAVAQLGEHLLCKQGVTGSIPVGSTSIPAGPCGLVGVSHVTDSSVGIRSGHGRHVHTRSRWIARIDRSAIMGAA